MSRYDFASDNVSGAAPEALQALVAANEGDMAGYGADPVCARAADLIRRMLDADAEVRFVSSGTAANAAALSMLAGRHEAVLAHEHAHIRTDETGAPAFFGGGLGLAPLPGPSGRVDPAALAEALAAPEYARRQSPGALSLTQVTEYGAVYDEAELRALIAPAKAAGLGVHLDGARLAAAAAAGFDVRAVARLGVDILVLGGAKAGMPPTEAFVLLDKGRVRRLDARLKQMGQSVSKQRFLAAPWVGMLESGAYEARARHAQAMAARLAEAMPFPLAHPVQANMVFAHISDEAFAALGRRGWTVYRGLDGTARFVCSWSTSAEAVDALAADLKAAA